MSDALLPSSYRPCMGSTKKCIAVGMSGGVDSTITAHLLKEQGHHVVGLTMKIWDDSFKFVATKSGCFGPNEEKDIQKAKEAADKLGIEHRVITLRDDYKQNVLDYFRNAYRNGLTPNPCVMCNQKIKFGMLWERAIESGEHFDCFATGHYARVEFDEISKRYLLKKGVDNFKDQSYFLYRLSQEQLGRVLLPLGHFNKAQIKDLAREVGFKDYADQKESQDFLECDDYGVLFEKNEFLPGNIVDVNGEIMGQHQGIIYYTVGQRKGLNIGAQKEPLHVVKIDAQKNEVVVGPKDLTYSKTLTAHDLNWIAFDELKSRMNVEAKVRLAAPAAACTISPLPTLPPLGGGCPEDRRGAHINATFLQPVFAITPGQSVVFYQDDVVLGGGVIG